MRRVGRITAAAVVSVGLVAGCAAGQDGSQSAEGAPAAAADEGASPPFHGTLVEPPIERPDLTLEDTSGNAFSLSARPDDEVTVVFFGYTHCPDRCPTMMADLAAARRQLPSQAGTGSPSSS